jgi:hypothetical protein
MTVVVTAPNRVWTDAFGSALCSFEGGYGGRVALVVVGLEAKPDLARDALKRLSRLPRFKGRVGLAVLEHLHAAPVSHAIRQLEASVVIALEHIEGVAARGPKLKLEAGVFTSTTGLEYAESGEYAAWDAGWLASKLTGTLEQASVTASLASSLGLASAVCGLNDLERTVLLALS